jgi:hypothetical protein
MRYLSIIVLICCFHGHALPNEPSPAMIRRCEQALTELEDLLLSIEDTPQTISREVRSQILAQVLRDPARFLREVEEAKAKAAEAKSWKKSIKR